MLTDLYARNSDATNYKPEQMETTDALNILIQKIENVLMTSKGDVLGDPGFGCNLEKLVFTVGLSEAYIANYVTTQISNYCNNSVYSVTPKVTFWMSE